jgi:2-C-methyl-D-erythritol 4-phosphate cytidylyltransferase/2-C-methyl-D-erythritol 2,4-cyclodiphosphate synthase
MLAGKPLIAHSYAALTGHPAVDDVLVVIGPGQQAALEEAIGRVPFVVGGVRRQDSVRIGLDALNANPPMFVLIHDAARPFVPSDVVDRLLEPLQCYEGALPALPVFDTLVRWEGGEIGLAGMIGETVPRENLYRVQTPQAFIFDAVRAAHRIWPDDEAATDDGQMVRDTGHEVILVQGDEMLEKITYPADFAAAEARLLRRTTVRVGTGFDVHRLAEGEQLWLCGVRIESERGLAGHSDADVALHAVVDAVLGACGAGDIGQHFPPSDPQWRGAPSSKFLEHAVTLARDAGYRVGNVDLTLICEAPKIGPHRDAMRARLAGLLGVGIPAVNVKATTTERLGFTGRGEGIAAQAVATLVPL